MSTPLEPRKADASRQASAPPEPRNGRGVAAGVRSHRPRLGMGNGPRRRGGGRYGYRRARLGRQTKHGRTGGAVVGLFKMYKLVPMLTTNTGCKMAALLGRHNGSRALLADHAPAVMLFGHRRVRLSLAGRADHHQHQLQDARAAQAAQRSRALLTDHVLAVALCGQRCGRLSLTIDEDTQAPPAFLIELPMLAAALHRQMATGTVKLALESDTRSARRRLVGEYVWVDYCNGRKTGYAIRRKDPSDDERHVLRLLGSFSMGAGVPPPLPTDGSNGPDGELTYMRAHVERVVGSKDSEAFYMINPDDDNHGWRCARARDRV